MIRSFSRPVTKSSPLAARNAEVAGAQERPLAGRQEGAEVARRGLRVLPVAAGDARAGDPDLPLAPGRPLDPRSPDRPTTTRCPIQGRPQLTRPLAASTRGARPGSAAGDEQRRLGQAVAGVERLGAEAARREGRREALQRLGAHRLGAVEGHPPGREVEPRQRLRARLAHAELVGEVRAAAGRPAVAGDRLQPAQRPLQEGHRRHQHAACPRRAAAGGRSRSAPCRGRAAASPRPPSPRPSRRPRRSSARCGAGWRG